jgi:UDPglucose 6-dehydrogenase
MNLTIIGAGYVGLAGAVCFANLGYNVTVVETNTHKLTQLQQGTSPIYEESLSDLLQKTLASGHLHFTADMTTGVMASTIVMLCVGTPQQADGQADLSYVKQAVLEIATHSTNEYKLVVEKSTVPVNTHHNISQWLAELSITHHLEVASNPEFLREGKAVHDFMHPNRIVCGVASEKAQTLLKELYHPFTTQNTPIIFTDVASAELIKQAANSFLAMKISYANMLAELCEHVGANITAVVAGLGLDNRIGKEFLQAGIGFGGSCFPKDLAAFIRTGEEHGLNLGLLRETLFINNRQRERLINKINATFGSLHDKTLTILGLAFKPHTNDVRETPALYIVRELLGRQATLKLYDPIANHEFQQHFKPSTNLVYCDDLDSAVTDSDAVILLTEWPEFVNADFAHIKILMAQAIIFDGRNALAGTTLQQLGFSYQGMGSYQKEGVLK